MKKSVVFAFIMVLGLSFPGSTGAGTVKVTPLGTSDCPKPFRMNVFGDVYISKGRYRGETHFTHLKPFLEWAHINVANFEGVVSTFEERSFPSFPFALKISPKVPSLLAKVGIKHVTRANNHSMDYGLKGLTDTNAALETAGIHFAGVGNNINEAMVPLIVARSGIRVGLLSFNMTYPKGAWATETTPGTAYPYVEMFKTAIANTKKKTDFVVVIFHWGEELSPEPRDYQPVMSRLAIKNGADLVFGHHAHTAQGITKFDGKTAAYGLGNLVFTAYTEGADFGLGAHIEFCKTPQNSGVRVAFSPLDTLNKRTEFATRPMSSKAFAEALEPYLEDELFARDTLFYLEDKKKTATLAEWMSELKIEE